MKATYSFILVSILVTSKSYCDQSSRYQYRCGFVSQQGCDNGGISSGLSFVILDRTNVKILSGYSTPIKTYQFSRGSSGSIELALKPPASEIEAVTLKLDKKITEGKTGKASLTVKKDGTTCTNEYSCDPNHELDFESAERNVNY